MDEFEAELQKLLDSARETLTQIEAMRASIAIGNPVELRMASLLEYQFIFGEAQAIQQNILATLQTIAAARQALALEKNTEEYHAARRASEALAKSNTGLRAAIERAIDEMRGGVSLGPVREIITAMIEAIREQSILTILLARHSSDEAVSTRAGLLENGLAQMERVSAQEQLKLAYANLSKLEIAAAKFGSRVDAPLDLQNKIEEIEQEIARLKNILKPK